MNEMQKFKTERNISNPSIDQLFVALETGKKLVQKEMVNVIDNNTKKLENELALLPGQKRGMVAELEKTSYGVNVQKKELANVRKSIMAGSDDLSANNPLKKALNRMI
jgi:hypothetical protein